MSKLVLLAAVATLVAAGCGGGDDNGEQAAGAEQTTASGQVPFDRAFIDAMVPHHEAAIEMARNAKQAGLKQPELVQIADDIIATQQKEIDQMLAWREEWFGSREREPADQAVEALGLTMADAGMEHSGDFSDAHDVDQTFAGMMIGHHMGAIRMAELAEERAQHDETKQLAEDIIAAQQREIEILEKHAAGGHG
jgi:uncharacterized protein (DUF305 family)